MVAFQKIYRNTPRHPLQTNDSRHPISRGKLPRRYRHYDISNTQYLLQQRNHFRLYRPGRDLQTVLVGDAVEF